MRERTLKTRRVFSGRVLALEILDVELEDGRRSVREIVRHARAVGVLPRLPDGRFLLVRQYRKAMDAEMIEICAGLVEPGEAPEDAARRELREETGCCARSLRRLGALCSSPGYTDEVVDLYLAECDPPSGGQDLDGDEQVEVLDVDGAGIERWIREGRLTDAKSVAAWSMYRLLGKAGGEEEKR